MLKDWFYDKISHHALGASAKEMQKFVNGLKTMSDEDMGAVVAVDDHRAGDARERDDRGDREVDARRDEHDGLSGRHHEQRQQGGKDVAEVFPRRKSLGERRQRREVGDAQGEDEVFAREEILETMGHGRPWTVDSRRWAVDGGRWTVDGGRWAVDGGRWTVDGASVGSAEGLMVGNHGTQHPANFLSVGGQVRRRIFGQIAAGEGRAKPVESFLQFTIRVGEFAEKMGGIPALRPCFREIRTNRSGTATHLARQRIRFLLGKRFADAKQFLLKTERRLINIQFPITLNYFRHIHSCR